MTTTHTEQSTEIYLSTLRANLGPITLAEREDILREIGAHIRDSVEAGMPVEMVLARLGVPEQLASEYRGGNLISAARRSVSPLLLLRATLRLASKGIAGMFVFFFGLFGYAIGLGLVLTGILKLFMPGKVGLWVETTVTGVSERAGSTTYGMATQHPSHEILGWWAVPVNIIGGIVILALTTLILRLFLHTSRDLQARLAGSDKRQ